MAHASYYFTNSITFRCRQNDASLKDICLLVRPKKEIIDTTRRENKRLATDRTEVKYNQEGARIKYVFRE